MPRSSPPIDTVRVDEPHRLRLLLTALVVVLLALTGCSDIPTQGPVGVITAAPDERDARTPVFDPDGPAAGASPEQIIQDFITAGTGAGNGYSVARQFLTPALARTWAPEERIVLFRSDPRVEERGAEGVYQIQLETTGTIDSRGLRTNSAVPATETVDVRVEQVDGEWRIGQIPDGILLAQGSAQNLLISHNLYFYSVNYRYWVPDARWFVRRAGVTAQIVQTLLAGPAPYLQGAVTSAFPEGVTLARDSVPITSGVATVELSDEVLDGATNLGLQQMSQQLQVNVLGLNDVTSVELTAGQPLPLGDPSPELIVPELTPDSGSEQVAVLADELVRVRNGSAQPIDGLESVADRGPRDPAASPSGSAYAFLDGARNTLFVIAPDSPVREIARGSGLTQPSFDPDNRIWSVRSAGGRSEVLSIPPGGTDANASIVSAGWLTDRTVKELRISGDGSRALVVTDVDGKAEVLLAGIIRSTEGVPQTLTTPLTLVTDGTIDTAKWAGQTAVVASSTGADEAIPVVLGLNGETEAMAALEGVQNLSAGTDVDDAFYAQAGGTLYRRIGNSWVDEQLDVIDPAFPG